MDCDLKFKNNNTFFNFIYNRFLWPLIKARLKLVFI